MQREGEGACLEMVRQCGFVCMCVYTQKHTEHHGVLYMSPQISYMQFDRHNNLMGMCLCVFHIGQTHCLDSDFHTYTSLHGHMYAYVSGGKGEQRTDRACLEIRLYREIGKRTCLQTHVCMCECKSVQAQHHCTHCIVGSQTAALCYMRSSFLSLEL